MAIEKLTESVFIDREAKVIYFSSLDEESRFRLLVEMNRDEGFSIKSANDLPKPKARKRRKNSNPNSRMNEKQILEVATAVEKKKFEATKKEKGFLAARGEFLKNRGSKEADAATAEK